MGISLYAQDVIVKKDGTTIMAKVLSVGTTTVEYKKWSNQDGPTYTIEKSELLSINYANGEKDVFEEPVKTGTPAPVVTTPTPSYTQEDISYAVSRAVSQTAYKSTAGRGKIIGGSLLIALVGVPGLSVFIPLLIADSPFWVSFIPGFVGLTSTCIGAYLIKDGRDEKWAAMHTHQIPVLQHDFKVGDYTLTPSVDIYNNRMTKQKGIGAGLAFRF